MIYRINLTLIFFLIFFIATGKQSKLEIEIDEFVHPLLKGNNFSGVILVKDKNSTLLHKCYGFANHSLQIKNSLDTKFQIASLSKSFTAALILKLSEKGMLKLDDSIIQYFPELNNFKTVTIHHLLGHRSGIPDINRKGFYKKLLNEEQTALSLFNHIKEFKPAFKPNEKYVYSNSNYNILARIIEIVTKQSFEKAMGKYLLHPLKLMNTGHRQNLNKKIKGLAVGHIPSGYFSIKNASNINWSAKTGNGSLYATTEDLSHWVVQLMNGNVLKKSSLQIMLDEKYAWFRSVKFEKEVFYYNGSSLGYSSYVGYYPVEEVSIIVLGNNDIALATKIGEGIAAKIFGKESVPFMLPKPFNMEIRTQKEIEGIYQFPWYNFEILIRDNQWIYKGSYPYYEVPLIPVGENKLFNRFFWSNLILEKSDKGQEIYWEGNPKQRGLKVIK